MVFRNCTFTLKIIKLDCNPTSYAKINSKLIIDLNVKAKTLKFLEENRGGQFHDLELGKGILYIMPKAQATKGGKIAKLKFIKVKNICVSKDTIKNVKRQTIEWEKIFSSYTCVKRFLSRIYKEILHSIIKRKINE